jgi:hypothetical protein
MDNNDSKHDIKEDFNLTKVEAGYRYKIWVKALNKKHSNKREFMEKVLQDAKEGRIVTVKGGLYYSCARFIKKYHKSYTFVKTQHWFITCCYAYPEDCGGKCCKAQHWQRFIGEEDGCGCDYLPRSSIHLKNCYDDCCNIVKIISRRKFDLSWQVKA